MDFKKSYQRPVYFQRLSGKILHNFFSRCFGYSTLIVSGPYTVRQLHWGRLKDLGGETMEGVLTSQ